VETAVADRSCIRSSSGRPGWSPSAWSAARFERFLALVVAALDLRFGPATVDRARGTATVLASGGDTTLGLVHLADRCAALPERQWRMAVYEHVASLASIEPMAITARMEELDAVRADLKLRLHPLGHPDIGQLDPVTGPGPPGLVTTLVVDLGGAAAWVPAAVSTGWPVSPRSLFPEALDNTWRDLRCRVEQLRLGDAPVLRVTGGSFYTATVVLRPPALCLDPSAPPTPHDDVVVAVPTAHEVLVHPVGEMTPDALPQMAAAAATAYRQGPDRLTADLLRWSVGAGWTTVLVGEWS
jgi:hypothetical protein